MKRKLWVATALAGLVVAATAPATSAAGKELKLFLRWDGTGTECGATYLSPEDEPDPGNGCAFVFQPAQEVLVAAGMGPLTHEWPGAFSKPITLRSGKITGEFVVRDDAAVQATLEIELSAVTKKGSVDIGTFTSDPFNAAVTQRVPVTFELDVPKKLVNQKVQAVSLATTFRGLSVHGYIELDNPAAFLSFPVK